MTALTGGPPGEVPRQVPPGPRRFVNRDGELAAVRRLLAGSPARIAVCAGLPGVGKTALVRAAVERHGAGFPGGELLVEFGEPGGGGISVGDALASCLLALGVAESVIPSRLADRVGLYRTRTSTRPTLVVLDDVSDPAQVSPLVPTAPGSLVLVTSTARLTELRLDGAEPVDIEPLDADSGARMVRELCGPRVDAEPDGSPAGARVWRAAAGPARRLGPAGCACQPVHRRPGYRDRRRAARAGRVRRAWA